MEEIKMKIKKIRLKIETQKQFFNRLKTKFKGLDKGKIPQKETSYSFENLEQWRKTFTPKRIELLHIIKHKKPKSINQLAKISNRNIKNIYEDIEILKDIGLVELKEKKLNGRLGIMPLVNFDELRISIPV